MSNVLENLEFQHYSKSKIILYSTIICAYLQDPYIAFLEEFGLSSVPAEILTEVTNPLPVCCCNKPDNTQWKVSHISSESFFKNKHGELQNHHPMFTSDKLQATVVDKFKFTYTIICLIRGLIFLQGQSKLGSSLIKCEFQQQASKKGDQFSILKFTAF